MKHKMLLLILAAMLFSISGAFAQPDLNIVWEKDIWPTEIKFAMFSKDGQWIYCAVNNTIVKMDAMTGEFVSTFDNTGVTDIYDMQISYDGKYLGTYNDDGKIYLWSTENEGIYKEIKVENKYFLGISFFPAANEVLLIMVEGKNKYVVKYDFALDSILKSKEVTEPKKKNWFFLEQIAVSHDGKRFVVGSRYDYQGPNGPGDIRENDKLELWDAETFEPIATLEDTPGGDGYWPKSIHFTDNDSMLTATKKYNTVTTSVNMNFFNLSNYKAFLSLNSKYEASIVRFIPDSYDFLSSILTDNGTGMVFLWNNFNKIDSLEIFASDIDFFGSHENWKAFCGGYEFAGLISNKKTSISDPKIEPCDFLIFVDTNEVTIELNDYCNASNYLVSIYDTIGNRVFNQDFVSTSNMIKINNALISGTYIIKLQSGDNSYSRTFQVVR